MTIEVDPAYSSAPAEKPRPFIQRGWPEAAIGVGLALSIVWTFFLGYGLIKLVRPRNFGNCKLVTNRETKTAKLLARSATLRSILTAAVLPRIPQRNWIVIDCSMVPEWSFELQNQPTDDGDTVVLFTNQLIDLGSIAFLVRSYLRLVSKYLTEISDAQSAIEH